MTSSSALQSPQDKIWASQIWTAEGVTDRGFRKWIVKGTFPKPDGNVNGRNFWLRSTYERWRADVLVGRYAVRRRPRFPASAAV